MKSSSHTPLPTSEKTASFPAKSSAGSAATPVRLRISFVAAFGMIIAAVANAAPLPQDLKLTVSAGGQTQTLNLHKRTARTGDFILYTWDAANGYLIQPTPEVRTFRGTVTENPNALVIAFIDTNGKLTAHCFDREYAQNQRWKLSSVDVTSQLVSPATPAPMPTQPVAAPRDGSTGIPKVGPKVPTGTSPGGIPYGSVVEYELGMDLFVAAYNRAGQSVENTLGADELNAMLYEQQMERDMLVRVVVPVSVVRKENFYPTDPGTGSLSTLRAEWLKEPLYSKRWDGVWGSEGGVANSSAIGKDESSVSLGAVFHENMHNWGAFHLAYQADGMGGNQPSVGPMTVQVMRAKRKEAIDEGKLPLAQPYTDPLPPFTHVDVARTMVNTPIDIDVLANDMDANGDALTVSSFTTNTVPGGTVTLNADGTLHYVPPPGYQGKDMIVYTAQDDSPMHLKTREVVHIEVTGSGLTARYKFDEASGTTASEASGGPSALLNGTTFSASSVNSPMGKGVRAWGYQNNDDIENANWSGIILGANQLMPTPLIPDNSGIHFTPFESQYNAYSAGFDIMDGNYTFSTWFRCDDLSANGDLGAPGYVVSKWWHPETRVGWDMQIVNKQLTLHWRIFDGAQGIRTLTAPAYPFSNGGWYHLTAAFDRATGEIRLYVNGTKVATQTAAFPSNGVIFNGRAPLCLGTFANGLYCYSDTRIHAKALSDAEVQAAFAEASPGSPRLLDSSLSVAAIAGNPLKQSVTGSVWNGGDNNATYSVLNGPAWLTINAAGELTGTPGYADAAAATATVRVTDGSGHSADLPVNLTVVTKGVAARYYDGGDGSVASLTSRPSYPNSPYKTIALGDFRIPANTDDNYGVDSRAWLTPSVSGDYTFWIASDDSSELWLSSDENSAGAVRIAYLSGATGVENWTANPSQQSVTIPLVAGHRYFIKSLFAEGSGGDHMEVAWAGPGIARQVIPQANLIPYRADPTSSALKARWKMDDATGTTVTDSSGNGANGTIVGTDTWTAAGKIDGAIQLTGATSAVNINKPDINGAWTASMWVMRKSNTRSESRLMNSPSASLRLEQYNGTHKVGVTQYGVADLTSNYTAPLDTWVHLTFVGNGTDTRLYVNGALQYTFPIVIPCPMTSLGYSVEGAMDEVQVYNRALTPAEVSSVYQYSAPVPPAAPVAANDTVSGRQDAVIVADPLFNDTDANGDTLAIQSFTQGAHGSVTQSGNYLNYTPDPDWAGAGTDTFTYAVTDGQGGVTSATVTVNVTPVNHQPVFTANPIAGSAATLNQPYTGTLAGSAHDTFASETLTFSKVSGPAWLNIDLSGALSGTPTNGDYGAAGFVVRATDTRGVFADATLNIAVTLANNNGVWSDPAGGTWLSSSGWNGGAIANGADKTADFSTLNLTANATVTLAGPITLGGLTFGDTTPSHDWTLGASGSGRLTLSVTSGTPTITVNNRTATIAMEIAGSQGLLKLGAGTLSLTAANTYTGLTTVYGGSGASTLILANPSGPAIQGNVFIGKAGGSGGGGILQLGANNQLTGNSLVTFDHAFGSQHAYFKLNGFSTSIAGLQNGGADLGGEVQNGASTDSTLTLAGAGNYTFGPTNGYHGVISNGSTGKLHLVKSGAGTQTLTGANTYTGTTTVNGGTLAVTGSLASGSAVFVNSTGTLAGTGTVGGAVTVAAGGTLTPGVNAIATLTVNNTVNLAGSTVMQISKSGSTLSTDAIAGMTIITYGGNLTVANIGSTALAAGDSFRLFVANGYAGNFAGISLPTLPSGLVWVTNRLAVDGTISVDATPVFSASSYPLSVASVGSGYTGSISSFATDAGDTLTYSKVSGPAWLTVAANGTLSGTPASGDAGSATFTVRATDASGVYADATITMPVDSAPLFSASTIALPTAATGSAYYGSLASYAMDPDANETLTFSKVSGPSWLIVNADGSLSGTPVSSDVGTGSFTVRVTDSKGLYDTATVTIVVDTAPAFTTSPIALPVATAGSGYSGSLASYASDADAGDTLAWTKVSGPAWLSVAANGSLTGTPTASDAGTGSFTVRVTDSKGLSANATVTIPVDDRPVFTASAIEMPLALTGSSVSGSLAGYASDPDAGDYLTFMKVSGPAWLTVNADGTLSGTPGAGDVGSATFTVRVADMSGAYSDTTVVIPVENDIVFESFESGVVSPSWSSKKALSIVTDAVLGSGKALSLQTASYTYAIRNFPAFSLANAGDRLTLSFVFRYTQAPAASGAGFRFGFFDTNGNGYNVTCGTGGSVGIAVNRDMGGNFGSGGSTTTLSSTSSLSSFANTAKHTMKVSLVRTNSGTLGVSTVVDGTALATIDTAPSVSTFANAAMRNGNISAAFAIDNLAVVQSKNYAPVFDAASLALPAASSGAAYSASVAAHASDDDLGDTLTWSKVSGPAWLTVNANGTLTGTPTSGNAGANTFTVRVTDPAGASADATVTIQVN